MIQAYLLQFVEAAAQVAEGPSTTVCGTFRVAPLKSNFKVNDEVKTLRHV